MSAAQPSRSSRRRTITAVVLVAILAAVLVAVVVVRSGGEKVINADGDVLVLVGREDATDSTGLARGVLADVNGCLGFVREGEPSSRGTVLVWGHGTTIETPDPLRVRAGGTVYGIGDTIAFGGGSGVIDESSYFFDLVPRSCSDSPVFVMG